MSRLVKRHFRGDYLREARENAGFTQENLAREVDVALRTAIRWEQGVAQPKGAHLLELARVLNVAPDYFYAYEVAA